MEEEEGGAGRAVDPKRSGCFLQIYRADGTIAGEPALIRSRKLLFPLRNLTTFY